MKNFYEEFKKNSPQDEFTKYYKEYSYAKSLIDFAKQQNLKEDMLKYEQIQKNAVEQLQNLGYKFI